MILARLKYSSSHKLVILFDVGLRALFLLLFCCSLKGYQAIHAGAGTTPSSWDASPSQVAPTALTTLPQQATGNNLHYWLERRCCEMSLVSCTTTHTNDASLILNWTSCSKVQRTNHLTTTPNTFTQNNNNSNITYLTRKVSLQLFFSSI